MSESELLARAFAALGPGASWRELELVGDAVRESGDEEALAALQSAAEALQSDAGDRQAMDELADLAKKAGSSGFDALHLLVEVLNPSAHAHLRGGGRDPSRRSR